MKNHINKVISIFKEDNAESIYRSIGGKKSEGMHLYSMPDSMYKNIYSKLQKKTIYKDSSGDIFFIKDGLICEKTRPAICVSSEINKQRVSSDEKFIPHSPAAQLTTFMTKYNLTDDSNQEVVSQVKLMTTNIFNFFSAKIKEDKGVEPITVGFINLENFSKTSDKEIPLYFLTTQIVQRDVPYFFHSTFGMLHFSEMTDEHIYGMTTTQEDFDKWKLVIQELNDAPDSMFTYPKMGLKFPSVIQGDGKTILKMFEQLEEAEFVS
jgi:hypothetical protein